MKAVQVPLDAYVLHRLGPDDALALAQEAAEKAGVPAGLPPAGRETRKGGGFTYFWQWEE